MEDGIKEYDEEIERQHQPAVVNDTEDDVEMSLCCGATIFWGRGGFYCGKCKEVV